MLHSGMMDKSCMMCATLIPNDNHPDT